MASPLFFHGLLNNLCLEFFLGIHLLQAPILLLDKLYWKILLLSTSTFWGDYRSIYADIDISTDNIYNLISGNISPLQSNS